MFLLSKLQVEIELLDNIAPTVYWGSRLRGGYGDMLKEACGEDLELFERLFRRAARPKRVRILKVSDLVLESNNWWRTLE